MVVWRATDGNICIRPTPRFYSDSHRSWGDLMLWARGGGGTDARYLDSCNLLRDSLLSSHRFQVINDGRVCWHAKGPTLDTIAFSCLTTMRHPLCPGIFSEVWRHATPWNNRLEIQQASHKVYSINVASPFRIVPLKTLNASLIQSVLYNANCWIFSVIVRSDCSLLEHK